jgi:hypothetical protein|uniref:Uncharacterized protein n=1 Tax=viral metagenome TaxID=1070528 RepID=A0A6C0I9F7_9ZZZZ
MSMFKDISRFNNTNDYLPILTAVLIVDIIGIILSNADIIKSKFLKSWYQRFLLSAVLADVLVIFIGVIVVRAIYPYIFDKFSIINFILLMVVIQVIHDILFYIMLTLIPRGSNQMIDIFKDFADEVSYHVIIGDSIMVISVGLIASYLANFDANTNIIIFAVLLYLLQYLLYN